MKKKRFNNDGETSFWGRLYGFFYKSSKSDPEFELSAINNNPSSDKSHDWDWLRAPVFTLEEAATYLKIDESVLKSELEQSNIPGVCIAGQWRINRADLEEFLTPSKFGSKSDLALENPLKEGEQSEIGKTYEDNPQVTEKNKSSTTVDDSSKIKIPIQTDTGSLELEDSATKDHAGEETDEASPIRNHDEYKELPLNLQNNLETESVLDIALWQNQDEKQENRAIRPQSPIPSLPPEESSEDEVNSISLNTQEQESGINDRQISSNKSDHPNEEQSPSNEHGLSRKGIQPFKKEFDNKQAKPQNMQRSKQAKTVTAKIYTSNMITNTGRGRLPDRHVVWLDYRYLHPKSLTPFPGDTVEFELYHGRNRFEGRNIRVVSHERETAQELQQSSTSDKTKKSQSAEGNTNQRSEPSKQKGERLPPTSRSLQVIPLKDQREEENTETLQRAIFIADTSQAPPKNIPLSGTDESQGMYQNAAVARAEGRYDDAQRFFEQAINRGGGTQVYTAYFKMLIELRGKQQEARKVIQRGIYQFPNMIDFYIMYGQMERRSKNYERAELIFREGLKHSSHVNLRWGLGQTLVQIGTENSLNEAGEIFSKLDKEGKLNKTDRLYQRFKALRRSQRANRAYDFFQSAKLLLGIAGKRDLPQLPRYATDLVVEISDLDFKETFGLAGSFLVRCFQGRPQPIHILELSRFLRDLDPQFSLGIQNGRDVVLNPTLAFIAVPNNEDVRDQVMNILSVSNEAIIPLDDSFFARDLDPLVSLKEILGEYLGRRNLYDSTHPVSGRRFFGRERLLLELTDQVKMGHFLGIYGLRKMGKTSLVFQLRDEKLINEAVAYVDLQASAALEEKNCAPLYYELERDLYQRLKGKENPLGDILRLGKIGRFTDLNLSDQSRAGTIFGEDMKDLLDALQTNGSGLKRLVIVLDELERILPLSEQRPVEGYIEFFGKLRGLAQMYPGLIASVVVAANASISERGYWEGRDNPVFALYKRIFLPPFSEAECKQMIETLGKGMSVYWEEAAIQAIYRETGGHPFLTRVLCSKIVKENIDRPITVTANMVEAQISPFIGSEGDKLEQITELLHTNFPKEEALLEKIALEENLGQEVSEITDESLRHLLGYHLIEADDNSYNIKLNLLKRWLRHRAGVR